MNKVFETRLFVKKLNKLDFTERIWLSIIKKQLKQSLKVGKPLRFSWFREKKFGSKRLLFLVSHFRKRVLLLNFVSKKQQKEAIEHVMKNKQRYLKVLNSPNLPDTSLF